MAVYAGGDADDPGSDGPGTGDPVDNGESVCTADPDAEECNCGGGVEAARAAYEAALAEQEAAKAEAEKTEGKTEAEIQADIDRMNEAEANVENAYSALVEALEAGDPVLVTTGRYIFEEADIVIPGSVFSIGRRYVTEDEIAGSLGVGWVTSLDSRIIRGRSVIKEQVIKDLESSANNLYQHFTNINVLSPEDWEIPEIAEEVFAWYEQVKGEADALKAIRDRGAYLHGLNGYVLYNGTPSAYEGVGNEHLTLVDESGNPIVYKYQGDGKWLPGNAGMAQYRRLESKNGGGAESIAGFIEYRRGGEQWHYNGSGLLEKVVSLDEKETTIVRDENQKIRRIVGPHGSEYTVSYTSGRISNITGPEGQSVYYGYTGSALTSVTDTEGDTGRYTYEEGRLKRIVKPDESYIELMYGYDGAGGTKLVSATKHEEGASERFDYYLAQKMTVYTNHSGVKSEYWYDGNHRTVKEAHGDGSLKEFQYNELGQMTRETVNGAVIQYVYDSRGNVREKAYSDGSRERWVWNVKDQQTKYTDRDGVITEWVYDTRGNCTQIRIGGVAVFRGVYNNANQLIESQQGERGIEKYGYDYRGYVTSRSVEAGEETIREGWEYDGLGRIRRYSDGRPRKRALRDYGEYIRTTTGRTW